MTQKMANKFNYQPLHHDKWKTGSVGWSLIFSSSGTRVTIIYAHHRRRNCKRFTVIIELDFSPTIRLNSLYRHVQMVTAIKLMRQKWRPCNVLRSDYENKQNIRWQHQSGLQKRQSLWDDEQNGAGKLRVAGFAAFVAKCNETSTSASAYETIRSER